MNHTYIDLTSNSMNERNNLIVNPCDVDIFTCLHILVYIAVVELRKQIVAVLEHERTFIVEVAITCVKNKQKITKLKETMEMEKYMIVIAILMSAAQISSARNVKTSVVNLKDPVKTTSPYMTYEELLYILQSKHGHPSSPPRTLTPCARAILGCCEGKVMNENCSVSLKCGAYFFDDNPCEEKFIIDALEAAKIFYEQFNTIAG